MTRRVVGSVVVGLALTGALGLPALATTSTKTTAGKVATVNAKSENFTLKVLTKTHTIYWNSSTKVTLSSKASTTSAIKVGDSAVVKYTVSSNKWLASSIALKPGSTK